MKTSKLFIGLAAGAFLIGCNPDPESDLDSQLQDALTSASGGVGADYYLIPDSDDLVSIPQDPKNPLSSEKVALGQLLFHETGLAINPKYASSMGTYSCASCHHAGAGFQAGRIQGIAEGGLGFGVNGEGRDKNPDYPADSLDVQPIRSPTVLNAAYQEVMLWNGQFGATGVNNGTESQWSEGTPKVNNHLGYQGIETQAIAGLTVHRMGVDMDFITRNGYKEMYDAAFADWPEADRYSLETTGLAIAAFERTILANEAPFQRYLRGELSALSESQKQGALLFFGEGNCASCHNGPSLANMEFYALGMKDLDAPGVYGNGLDDATKYGRGGFTGNADDNYKFKVPQLYSLAYSPFYGHGGNFETVREVIAYKNAAVPDIDVVPASQYPEEFVPLDLTEEQIDMLTDFVLNGLDDNNVARYSPSALLSGNCFPNNDETSRTDMGCN